MDCNTRSFKALMATLFLGALNDNIFKLSILFLIQRKIPVSSQPSYIALTGALFVLPFILFSPHAGLLADRYPKAVLIKFTKLLELAVMLTGAYFFILQSISGVLVALFFMGLQSTLFSPCKYGILPEMLDHGNLSKGNGFTEFWTFTAIVMGSALAGLLTLISSTGFWPTASAVVFIAALGVLTSTGIENTSHAGSSVKFKVNPFTRVINDLREIKLNRDLFLVLLAITYFWAYGALFQLNIPIFAKETAHLSEFQISLLLSILAIGIGAGSIAAGRVSLGKVELGLVPIGAFGLSIMSIMLVLSHQYYLLTLLAVLFLGLCGGFYIVPLDSFFQANTPLKKRGRFLAANNFLSYSAMLLASIALFAGSRLGLSASQIFIVAGIATFAVAIYIIKTMPATLLRCINWIVSRTIYNMKVKGMENVPKSGGALLVCNHLAYIDPMLILASLEREVRFLMYRPIYRKFGINLLARTMKVIPISTDDGPKELIKSFQRTRKALQNGELVCIFPEGEISRSGQLLSFNRGFEHIIKGLDVPIIPVFLDRVWGSIFSFKDGRFFWKVPKEIPYPVTVLFGKPLPSSSDAFSVRQAVQELGAEAFSMRDRKYQLLHRGFIRQARRTPLRTCIVDSTGKKLNYLQALSGALIAAKALKTQLDSSDRVGVLLPPSAAGALINAALMLSGKIPVNLNYTAGVDAMRSAISQAKISRIITSERFLKKINLPKSDEHLLLEKTVSSPSFRTKLFAALAAMFVPVGLIEKYFGGKAGNLNSLATIIFSSGSTGTPKGVMLSHGNIASNIESLYDIFQLQKKDAILAALPFFHSFGFTGTLWMPLLAGIKAVYHFNPLDAATIGKLAQQERTTMLLTTPTFLLAYIRKCKPEQFAHLRLVITGAEKLSERVANSFYKKFRVLPLEGYGCTELSPVAMVNLPDYQDHRVSQTGHKTGTVGRPIPGVAVKVVDPDTFADLPPGTRGLLLVKGPNVMLGYLNDEQKTAEVIRDGWYVTGDLASIDEDGFVTIHDRLSRFSKIGGEMVPHIKVEEEVHRALNREDRVCVVTSLPDGKRGEKLVLLTTVDFDYDRLIVDLRNAGLPNLWIFKKENIYKIDEIPVLGSGKLDLKKIKELAEDLDKKRHESDSEGG